MEGGNYSYNSLYANFENYYNNNNNNNNGPPTPNNYPWLQTPPPPPPPPPTPLTTAIDRFLWSQENNNFFSNPQQTLFDPLLGQFDSNNNFDFICCDDDATNDNYIGRVSHLDRVEDLSDGREVNIISAICSEAKNVGSSAINRIKGQWSLEEDRKLIELVEKYGNRKWAVIAEHMVGRIGKQCRERWQNHLRPDIKKDNWTEEEEKLLIDAHERVGNRWAEIAKSIPGRTENSIKNHWNATKRKQTSKRKIKKPDSTDGIKQSILLEEYIKNKYFDNGSSTSTTSNSSCHVTLNNDINHRDVPVNNSIVPNSNSMSTLISDDDESISYLTFEEYKEEMDFMKNLFGNNDKAGKLMMSSANNFSFNFAGPTPRNDVPLPRESDGNNLLASSSESINMEQQLGINVNIFGHDHEAQDAFLYPAGTYFCSNNVFDGSFGNNDTNNLAMNQATSAGARWI